MYALVRDDVKGDRPDTADQNIPSYNGFHAGLHIMEQGKRKACFHNCIFYSQPPNNSVVKDIMDNLTIIIATKCIPFAFLL